MMTSSRGSGDDDDDVIIGSRTLGVTSSKSIEVVVLGSGGAVSAGVNDGDCHAVKVGAVPSFSLTGGTVVMTAAVCCVVVVVVVIGMGGSGLFRDGLAYRCPAAGSFFAVVEGE